MTTRYTGWATLRRHWKKGRKSKLRRHRKLFVESLEDRRLLAAEIEPNNTLATATDFFGAANTLTGWIDNVNDVDYFTTLLSSGDTLRLRYSINDWEAPAFLPSMEILDATGVVKARSPDGHAFSFTATADGTYALRLIASNSFGIYTGEYSIAANVDGFIGLTETEPNDTSNAANVTNFDAHFRGMLAFPADVDFYSFFGVAGQAIALKFAEEPTRNPAVQLYSPSGAVVAAGQSGLGLHARLAETGTYRFSVQSDNLAGTVTGAYVGQLLLAPQPEMDAELGNTFASATSLDLGPYVVSSQYLSPDASFASRGLAGSYIDRSLRGTSAQDDWRNTQTIAGTRNDPVIHFPQNDWGNRASLSLTHGSNDNWDDFSVQWDGYVRIATEGTQIYTASADGSRMWIDMNGDGSFDTNGSELLDNHWGSWQFNTLGPASAPLAIGDYRIRIQYEAGPGENNAYLLWSDDTHSAGAVSRNHQVQGVGILSSLSDVDVYAVNLTGTGKYEFRLDASIGGLATQNRRITLYNQFGQPLDYANNGRMATQSYTARPEATAKYFLTVEATDEVGLGPYELIVRIDGEFPVYRDIPLFYQDYSNFSRSNEVPEFLAFFESQYDVYQVDLTQTNPGPDTEHVDWTFRNSPSGCGGLAGGSHGLRRPSGSGTGDCDGNWDRLASAFAWIGLSYHENGHSVGLWHARHPLNVMSYGGQYSYFPIGSSNWIGGVDVNGDARTSYPAIHNMRNYLDWALEAGRIVLDDEANDDVSTAQWLDPFFGEMATDADPRNDQAVVVGALSTSSDIDVYRFTAAAGETFSADIDAAEFQYPLDAQLEILNASGTVIAANQNAMDRDTGIASVDPFLMHQFATAGDYYVRVRGEMGTAGNYRLKVTPQRAFDQDGPRVIASWPDGGSSVDGTRQLVFWFNDQLDPATLTSANIVVSGQTGGTRNGIAVFDPITSTLTWRGDAQLPPDTYTITLRSGPTGIMDLRGNQLDGEPDGVFQWPKVSGNGTAGGDFTTTFTVSQADVSAASVSFSQASRHPHNRVMFELFFNDELDVLDVYSKPFTLRGRGPDRSFNTADDTFSPVDVVYDRINNTSDHSLRVYSRGVLAPDMYRVEANLLDAAGNSVPLFETFDVPTTVPASALFTSTAMTTSGVEGTYINQSLRNYALHDDWQASQTVAGTRIDPLIGFYSGSFGNRGQVNISGGSDENWDNFSVQWDGVVVIPENGVRLFTRSDDGSRMWIDMNQDGAFNSTGAEFVDNRWGSAQGTTTGPPSVPLDAGTYSIRIQYEEGIGGNQMHLMWDYSGVASTIDGFITNPQVVDVNIQPNTVVTSPPSSIDVTFSEAIAVSTLTTSTYSIRYSPDPVFFDSNDSILNDSDGTIAWDPTLRKASFQPAMPWNNGYYLIELDGNEAGIASTTGRLLDGEYRDANIAGYAPEYGWNDASSGDGLPGGSYRASFVVAQPDLVIDLSVASFAENAGAGAATATLTRRYADLGAPLAVTLAGSENTAIGVPASVTIPANQASVSFDIDAVDDALLDGTQNATITAAAAGYVSGSATLEVTDHETLTVVIATASIAENAGAAATTATVTRNNTDNGTALTVTLTNGDDTEIGIPATITIPADQASVTFDVDAIDDTLLDGSVTATIAARAAGYVDGSDTVEVTDHETLTVAIAVASIAENAGTAATTATVTRNNTDNGAALTVTLASSENTAIGIPSSVTILANQASVSFGIDAVDDDLLDGTQNSTITASAAGYVSGSDSLDVTDHETLTVAIAVASIAENAGVAATTATVSRSNTDNGAALTVALASSNAAAIGIPSSVTIPANQASVSFDIDAVDDDLLDGTQNATITASAAGYVSGNDSLEVTDHETVTVAIVAASIAENAGTAATTATVTRSNTDNSAAVTVTLANSENTAIGVPASVTIPANLASVSFDIDAVDDDLLDGTQNATITASAAGYVSGNDSLEVTDHETLTVVIAASSIAENAGTAATTATVTRSNTDNGAAVTVTLANSNTTAVGIPASVTIPANQASVSFDINAVDDNLLDGTQNATITASAAGYVAGNDSLDVTDHETLMVAIVAASIAENAGAAATTATVTRSNTDNGAAVTVTLANSENTAIGIPASVTIPANQASVSFDINAVDDDLLDGTQNATITASAAGYVSGNDSLEVTDFEDQDGDGVVNQLEDGAPYGGDGNDDDILDRNQHNVASLPCSTGSGYITLASPEDTALISVAAADNPSVGDAPNGVSFPAGFVEFGVSGLAPGSSVAVTVYVETAANTYWKFEPTSGHSTPHWYPFMFDGSTGAKIYSDRVVLHFVDGERGDDDLIANGSIVDIGAPAVTEHPWQNPILPEDVNNQGGVTPLDVLTLIADLNMHSSHALPPVPNDFGVLPPYLDVTGDDSISPLDVLTVIAYLNNRAGAIGQEQGEGEPSGEQALVHREPTDRGTAPAARQGMPAMPNVSISVDAGSAGDLLDSASPHGSTARLDRGMSRQNAGPIAADYTSRGELARRTRVDTGPGLISLEPELGLNVDDNLLSLLAEDAFSGQRVRSRY